MFFLIAILLLSTNRLIERSQNCHIPSPKKGADFVREHLGLLSCLKTAGYSPPPNSAESPLPRVSLNNGNNYNDPIDEDLLVPNWVRIARTLK